MTGHTLRARARGASRSIAGSQVRSISASAGSVGTGASSARRTVSRVATTCSQTPVEPHVQTLRRACGPVPLAHSTPHDTPPRSATVASILTPSTERKVTRPASASSRAARVRSRANQFPIDAGKRDRHRAKGVNRGVFAATATVYSDIARSGRLDFLERLGGGLDERDLLK